MNDNFGPYHRVGEPGGPGCKVVTLPVKLVGPNDTTFDAFLFDAGKEPTELELLRTVAHSTGVHWGKDDLGWWAAVPAVNLDQPAEQPDPSPSEWSVLRLDDNGNSFEIARHLTRDSAEEIVRQFEISGHKQTYSLVRSV